MMICNGRLDHHTPSAPKGDKCIAYDKLASSLRAAWDRHVNEGRRYYTTPDHNRDAEWKPQNVISGGEGPPAYDVHIDDYPALVWKHVGPTELVPVPLITGKGTIIVPGPFYPSIRSKWFQPERSHDNANSHSISRTGEWKYYALPFPCLAQERVAVETWNEYHYYPNGRGGWCGARRCYRSISIRDYVNSRPRSSDMHAAMYGRP